jgi:hypothetical protein
MKKGNNMAALVTFGDVVIFLAGAVAGYYFPGIVAKAIAWVRGKLKI